jgi:hypothetical protein
MSWDPHCFSNENCHLLDIMPCSSYMSRRFGGTYRRLSPESKISWSRNQRASRWLGSLPSWRWYVPLKRRFVCRLRGDMSRKMATFLGLYLQLKRNVPLGPCKECATLPRCQVSRAAPWQETYLAQTHFRKTKTTRNHPHQTVLVTRTKVKTLHKQQTSHIYVKQYSNQSGLTEYNSGVRFPLTTQKF